MAGFRSAAAFSPPADLQLLPIRFERLRVDRYLVNNFVGDGLLLTRRELDRVVSLDIVPGDGLYERAFEKLFVSVRGQQSQLQLLAMRLHSRMAFLQQPTALHIFCQSASKFDPLSASNVDPSWFWLGLVPVANRRGPRGAE